MVKINWQDPPESASTGKSKLNWDDFAAALRENPGKWACTDFVHSSKAAAAQMAATIRNGQQERFKPAGSFDAQSDDETRMVWVVYVE